MLKFSTILVDSVMDDTMEWGHLRIRLQEIFNSKHSEDVFTNKCILNLLQEWYRSNKQGILDFMWDYQNAEGLIYRYTHNTNQWYFEILIEYL